MGCNKRQRKIKFKIYNICNTQSATNVTSSSVFLVHSNITFFLSRFTAFDILSVMKQLSGTLSMNVFIRSKYLPLPKQSIESGFKVDHIMDLPSIM